MKCSIIIIMKFNIINIIKKSIIINIKIEIQYSKPEKWNTYNKHKKRIIK